MQNSTTPKTKKVPTMHNVHYMLSILWKADKGTVAYTMYKNISEQIFYVYFFVYLTKYIFSCISNGTDYTSLVIMISIASLLHIVVHIVSAGHAYYIKLHSPIIYESIFNRIINKAKEMPLVRFEQPDFYDKFTRAFDESITRAMETLNNLSYAIAHLSASLLSLLVIASVDPFLILFIVPGAIGSLLIGKQKAAALYELDMKNTRDKRVTEYSKRVFYEKKYAAEIRLYSIRDVLFKRHKESFDSIYKVTSYFRGKAMYLQVFEILLYFGLSYMGSMLYITLRIKNGTNVDVGSYIAMVNALSFITRNLMDGIEFCLELKKNDLYIHNLQEFLETTTNTDPVGTDLVTNTDTIELRNVSFTYDGATKPVIQNLSLTIHKGERIALVGHNGAGKTTLVKLLMGLYKVTEGEILVGGKNINEYNPKDYHDHFGTVFQDLQIFALSISENVLMHTPQSNEERQKVIDALDKAQFSDKLAMLPKGIDTIISKEFDDDGVVLSGGQAQKIAIARVFAKDPDIVILDEPSSALDPIAEYNMYKNMLEVSIDKTVLFISHRLSSARVADTIYLLEHGQISESGSHESLMAQGGTYAHMFRLQAQNYQPL